MATVNTSLVPRPSSSSDSLVESGIPADDPRLELLSRIINTPSFQKATKLQALLRFIVETSIRGEEEEISEYRIGIEVFEKGADYSPLLDSSVRVQARQLRLKLHEYFDGPGRNETMVLEIPKGSYKPTFRSSLQDREAIEPLEPHGIESALATDAQVQVSPPVQVQAVERSNRLPWWVAAVFLAIAIVLGARLTWEARGSVPWPLSTVLNRRDTSHLVLADSAYQITSTANASSIGLTEYLRTKPRNDTAINLADSPEARLTHALAGGTFTSFADAILVSSLSRVAGKYSLGLDIKSSRDIDPRDLEQGNFIFAGSPSSNPWVSLYTGRLNFREVDNPSTHGSKMFLNTHPQKGEPRVFEGSSSDNAVRADYADLAVVPGLGEQGTVMLVQGLRHESTEAAARLLADPEGDRMLRQAIRSAGYGDKPPYFEALLAVRAVAGIPQVTGVSAIRVFYK